MRDTTSSSNQPINDEAVITDPSMNWDSPVTLAGGNPVLSAANLGHQSGPTPLTSTQHQLQHDGQPNPGGEEITTASNFGDLSAIAEPWDTLQSEQTWSSQSQSLFSQQVSQQNTEKELEGLDDAQYGVGGVPSKEGDQDIETFEQALESLPPNQSDSLLTGDGGISQQNGADSTVDSLAWSQRQASRGTTGNEGSVSVDWGDAIYGARSGELDGRSNSGNVFESTVGGSSELQAQSVTIDESVGYAGGSVVSGVSGERGRSLSSSDLDSMDPLLLGIRRQASQTNTTPHPSLETTLTTNVASHTLPKEATDTSNIDMTNKTSKDGDETGRDKIKTQNGSPMVIIQNTKDMQEMKEQVSFILQELKSMTTELKTSRSTTQTALEDTKNETKKTQNTVRKTQEAVDNLHKEIRHNQDKTQQAIRDTHKNIATIQNQVTQTLGSVQETRQEVNELKSQAQSNTDGVKSNKTDIQSNRDDIQRMKDDIKQLQDRQADQADSHKSQEAQNARMDRHMDRQEVINRRSNFVIFGVQETTGRRRENTEEIVIDVLQTFMPDGDWQPSDCVTAYRAGRRDDSSRGEERHDRPIVATLDRPSDVGFILRHRQGREEMRKVGLGCAQDLSRAQQQKIRDIKQEGKQAYYFKGRLVVRDNPYNRSRNGDRHGNSYDNRNRLHRPNSRQGTDPSNRKVSNPLNFPTRRQVSDQTFNSATAFRERNTDRGIPDTAFSQQQSNKQTIATQTNDDQSHRDDRPTGNPPQVSQDLTGTDRPYSQLLAEDKQQDEVIDLVTGEENTGDQTDYSSRTSGGFHRPREYRPRVNRRDTQQRYVAPQPWQNRQYRSQSRDRQNRRTNSRQQDHFVGYRPPSSFATAQNQPSYTPPSFLQAPQLQHLHNTSASFVPPPPLPPPPAPQFYPPYTANTHGGTHELSGAQWQAMWQRGMPARSIRANERRRERRNERGV